MKILDVSPLQHPHDSSYPKHNCSIIFIYYYLFAPLLFFHLRHFLLTLSLSLPCPCPPPLSSSPLVLCLTRCSAVATLCLSSCFLKQNNVISPLLSLFLLHAFLSLNSSNHPLLSGSLPLVTFSPLCPSPLHPTHRPLLPPLSVLSSQSLYPSDSRKCPSHSPT